MNELIIKLSYETWDIIFNYLAITLMPYHSTG